MLSLNNRLNPRFAVNTVKAEYVRDNKFFLIAKDFFEQNNKYCIRTESYSIDWSNVLHEEKIKLVRAMLAYDDAALETFEERMDHFINNPHKESGILYDLGKLAKQDHFDSFPAETLKIILEYGDEVFAYEITGTPRYEELKDAMLLLDDVCLSDLLDRLSGILEIVGDEYCESQREYGDNCYFENMYA